MNVLTAAVPSLVAALSVFIVAWLSKGRFEAMGTKIDGVRGEVDGVRREVDGVRREVDGVRADVQEVRQDIRDVRGELAGIRSDLTHVALAVGAKPRPQAGTA